MALLNNYRTKGLPTSLQKSHLGRCMRGFIPFTLNKFAFALLRAGFAQLIEIALRKSTLVLLWQHLFEANGISGNSVK
jgi:hypothetical protein